MAERIGRYLVVEKLGEGGMGVVYAARDEQLDRPVAIKMVRAAASADDRSRERLRREARAAASVNHPNICQLYEIGEAEEGLFIAMEFLEGESLAARLARGPLPLAEAIQTMLAILAAAHVLHSRGLVHRDLKPSNVFLTPVGVKLLDFGLVKSIGAEGSGTAADLTIPGSVVGTPRYLAPEQVRGDAIDARPDLFAAGALLFEMLAGRPAFDGETFVQLMHAVLHEMPPVLTGSPGIAAADRVLRRALAKHPGDRYPSAPAMAGDLRTAVALAESGDTVHAIAMTRLIVLPFRVLRSDPDTDFLAFSLPDAITGCLSGLESLAVRSSVTASQFVGDTLDLGAVATKADVDVVLTGTLLRAGDQLRVNAQLIEAPGGTVLWSQTSQVPLGDIFQLQDELTSRIVSALSLPLTAHDLGTLKHHVPASARAYELYLRANQLSVEARHWNQARELYLQCLNEDPRYAPAWARLGRIYRVLGIYSGEDADEHYARAEDAFNRALDINPDLSLAHNLYTNLEVELGRGKEAMLRLLARSRNRAADPELFAGLVQACRYCGLLEAAVAAYEHARRLDPSVRTSATHAYLMLGDYRRAIDANVEDPPLMNGIILQLMGREEEALTLLKELAERPLPRMYRLFIMATRAAIEGDREAGSAATDELLASWKLHDPCGVYYLARHLAYRGDVSLALEKLRASLDGGFCCYPFVTRDPWLNGLRGHPDFGAIVHDSERQHQAALTAFRDAGGDRLLGLGSGISSAVRRP